MFGGFGGGDRRDSNGNNGVPVWLIVFAVSIVTYAISYVLIRTISRYREYAADRGSALMTGAPENLMSALQKIASGITQIPQQDLREVAGMNAFFIVPTNWRSHVGELFMDHPPLEKRLAALAEISREMGKHPILTARSVNRRVEQSRTTCVRSGSTGSSFSSCAFSCSSRGVVALLLLAGRDERPERAGLEAVDPVDRLRRRPRSGTRRRGAARRSRAP